MEHAIVIENEWLAARRALLAREKQLTRLRDEIAAERRRPQSAHRQTFHDAARRPALCRLLV
jgi:predicted dithiol-disulfide oxidoreductase (DUF899 family)